MAGRGLARRQVFGKLHPVCQDQALAGAQVLPQAVKGLVAGFDGFPRHRAFDGAMGDAVQVGIAAPQQEAALPVKAGQAAEAADFGPVQLRGDGLRGEGQPQGKGAVGEA